MPSAGEMAAAYDRLGASLDRIQRLQQELGVAVTAVVADASVITNGSRNPHIASVPSEITAAGALGNAQLGIIAALATRVKNTAATT